MKARPRLWAWKVKRSRRLTKKKAKSDQPKLLFLSDNYYPGWKAQVDDEETQILRANYTFRAVPLIAGEHVVRFYYDSGAFKIGLLITLISLGVLGVFVFKVKEF